MSGEYEAIRQKSEAAYNHLKDAVSDKAAAAGILQDAHALMDDCNACRNPRTIEDRIKQIIQALKGMSHTGSTVMPSDRAVAMTQMFEGLQVQVKQMPTY